MAYRQVVERKMTEVYQDVGVLTREKLVRAVTDMAVELESEINDLNRQVTSGELTEA